MQREKCNLLDCDKVKAHKEKRDRAERDRQTDRAEREREVRENNPRKAKIKCLYVHSIEKYVIHSCFPSNWLLKIVHVFVWQAQYCVLHMHTCTSIGLFCLFLLQYHHMNLPQTDRRQTSPTREPQRKKWTPTLQSLTGDAWPKKQMKKIEREARQWSTQQRCQAAETMSLRI